MSDETKAPSATPAPVASWDPLSGAWSEPRHTASTDNGRRLRVDGSLRSGIVGGLIGALVASFVVIPIARHNGAGVAVRPVASGRSASGRVSVADIAAAV